MNIPTPSADALAHSEQLQQHIREVIANNGGKISFAEFMQLALYAPGLGYYVSGNTKFGAGGDFITAPEISPLFSYAVANQCVQVMAALTEPSILEFGAGNGTMAADILLRLAELNCLPKKYCILEVSPELQARQQHTIAEKAPQLLERVEWLTSLPENFVGVVLANEVLDAMPVELFTVQQGKLQQRFVAADQDFYFQDAAIETPRLQTALENLQQTVEFADNYHSEVNLNIQPWLQAIHDSMQQGVVLLIDYGCSRSEYYHPQRQQGTLRTFYRHHVADNVLQQVGLQDITTHVDFTAVAEAAVAVGLEVLSYTNQAAFLLGNNILEGVTQTDNVAQFNQQQQIKQLTLPNEMGELFKVIALAKNIELALDGFQHFDLLHTL